MRLRAERGFTAAELLIVISVALIMVAIAIPWWLSYWSTATVRGGAQEVQLGLNRARMLAISTRQNICVEIVAAGYRFRQGTCAGTAWVGTGTDATGLVGAPADVTVTSPANPIFTQFGTASQTATLTVTGSGNRTLTVTVLPSGRVTIP